MKIIQKKIKKKSKKLLMMIMIKKQIKYSYNKINKVIKNYNSKRN